MHFYCHILWLGTSDPMHLYCRILWLGYSDPIHFYCRIAWKLELKPGGSD
jgi:hypothetical protein